MTRTRWILVALAVLAVAATLYWKTDVTAETPQFLTATVSHGSIVATVEATGTLQPVDRVEVGTQVTGTVQTLGADFNSQVTRGQVIATLDPTVLQSQVAQAEATRRRLEAELERARVEVNDATQKLDRARALAERQLLPRTELEAAEVAVESARANVKSTEAQLAQADAALEQSRANLSHTVIRAPVDGIVLSRNVDVGQTVAAGLQAPTLFVIAKDLGTMQLDASVGEADIGQVQPGQSVTFQVDAYPNETFTGTVRQVRLQPTVTQNVVSYTTVIDVPNRSHRLKPGMTATVSIETARVDEATRVPAAALRFRPTPDMLRASNGRSSGAGNDTGSRGAWRPNSGSDRPRPRSTGERAGRGAAVWVIEGGRLRPVPVTPGLSDGAMVELRDAQLAPGTHVVTGLAVTAAAPAPVPSSGSPLLPNFPRRPGGGRSNGR